MPWYADAGQHTGSGNSSRRILVGRAVASACEGTDTRDVVVRCLGGEGVRAVELFVGPRVQPGVVRGECSGRGRSVGFVAQRTTRFSLIFAALPCSPRR